MTKGRLEAFSDGVIAIIITIMVLELKVPHGTEFSALTELLPIFLSYLMSFTFVGIYWNNHHHLLHAVQHVNGSILWANLHLLFWLSLIPFTTGWMGENHFAPGTVALYGLNLLFCAVAFSILVRFLLRAQTKDSLLARAIGNGNKEKLSLALYVVGVLLSFSFPLLSTLLYGLVSVIWLVPDTRIERNLTSH